MNAERLNMGFVVFCNVKLQCMNSMSANMFTEKMKAISEVAECYNVSGRFDYLLKIYASSMKHYRDFVLNTLGMIENIASIEVFILSWRRSRLTAGCLYRRKIGKQASIKI